MQPARLFFAYVEQRGSFFSFVAEFSSAAPIVDAGITTLLCMTNHDVYDEGNMSLMLDTKVTSNTLFYNYFDGPSRR